MPYRKPITKEMVLMAMRNTKSNKAAARFLGCSYQHYKKYAGIYFDEEGGKTLLELHKNQCGKGIPKFWTNGKSSKDDFRVLDIIEGRVSPTHYDPEKIKYRMIEGGYLKEECYRCGFRERRVLDYKIPLILHFKDGKTFRYNLDNVEFLCYNCYFLSIGDIFNKNEVDTLETHTSHRDNTEAIDFQLDDYQKQRLEELGLNGPPKPDEDDPYDLVSRM